MKKIFGLFFLFIFLISSHVYAQVCTGNGITANQLSLVFSDPSVSSFPDDYVTDIEVNQAETLMVIGGIYAGSPSGSGITFPPSVANNKYDSFIMLESTANIGAPFFYQSTGGEIVDIEIDGNDAALIGGTFSGTVDLGIYGVPNVVTSTGWWNSYITKIGSNGVFNWTQIFQGTVQNQNNIKITAMTSNSSGDVIATGIFYGTVDFDPGPGVFQLTAPNIPGISRSDIFVVSLAQNGAFNWAVQFNVPTTYYQGNNAYNNEPTAIDYDAGINAIVVAGVLNTGGALGSTSAQTILNTTVTGSPTATRSGFVAFFDNALTPQSFQLLTGSFNNPVPNTFINVNDVKFEYGVVYLAGSFLNNIDLEFDTATELIRNGNASGGNTAFLSMYLISSAPFTPYYWNDDVFSINNFDDILNKIDIDGGQLIGMGQTTDPSYNSDIFVRSWDVGGGICSTQSFGNPNRPEDVAAFEVINGQWIGSVHQRFNGGRDPINYFKGGF